ncbi:hypothetical protein ACFYZI_41735 [Streptomyces griseorubiginosus]|uniref:hypothetical protein n=1 Tax=Streptomyces griseorubiginosus TaxID=67304 RepID=UPI0036C82F6D
MQNPFRDGGPLDVATGLLGLLLSTVLLWKGIQMAQDGSSWWWPLTAGVLVVLSLHGLCRRRRAKRQSSP